MTILEIIHLRLAEGNLDELVPQIQESLRPNSGIEEVQIFQRQGIVPELAIHVHHDAKIKSQLGVRLASSLEDYGLVKHTVWEER